MNVDFVRFNPPAIGDLLQVEDFVVFTQKPEKPEEEKPEGSGEIGGYLLECDEVGQLLSGLKKVRKNRLVGVMSSNIKVNKEAVMRKKVDVLLDFPERRIDYATLKLAGEKDVVIELAISKFLNSWGLKRTKIFEETIQTINVINKFDVPFVLTSGANKWYELRSKRQIYEFFSSLGAREKKEQDFMKNLIRRFTDPDHIAEGLEIIAED
ncbi:MAG: RNase P subunit p30 family protein [Archaeoglobaceae archaeon]